MKKIKIKKPLMKRFEEAVLEMIEYTGDCAFDECGYIIESYLDDLSEEEVVTFEVNPEELSKFLVDVVLNHFTSDKMKTQLKKEATDVVKNIMSDIKDYKKYALPAIKKAKETETQKKADKVAEAKLLKSLSVADRALLKRMYGK